MLEASRTPAWGVLQLQFKIWYMWGAWSVHHWFCSTRINHLFSDGVIEIAAHCGEVRMNPDPGRDLFSPQLTPLYHEF